MRTVFGCLPVPKIYLRMALHLGNLISWFLQLQEFHNKFPRTKIVTMCFHYRRCCLLHSTHFIFVRKIVVFFTLKQKYAKKINITNIHVVKFFFINWLISAVIVYLMYMLVSFACIWNWNVVNYCDTSVMRNMYCWHLANANKHNDTVLALAPIHSPTELQAGCTGWVKK